MCALDGESTVTACAAITGAATPAAHSTHPTVGAPPPTPPSITPSPPPPSAPPYVRGSFETVVAASLGVVLAMRQRSDWQGVDP